MKNIVDLVGRIFLSIIFLFEGYDSMRYFKETILKMAEYGITWQPKLLLVGSIFVLLTGGLMILFGYRSSLGAILLLTYWLPVTFIAHAFWNYSPPELRVESILFMKNIAITGGLLVVLVNGSQRFSIRRLFATTKVN